VAVTPIDGVTLRIQQLDAAEAAINRFAEKELQLPRRLVELRARGGLGALQIGVRQRRCRQQHDDEEQRWARRFAMLKHTSSW